jgi:hypothetical protein
VKLAQYTVREAGIISADSDGIRKRWMWGLRLLHDPDAFAPGSTQLRPGVADDLIKSAAKRDIKLSEREIRYRLQCARAYPTEAEFGTAVLNFPDWTSLREAGFPAFEVPADEPPADWRTDAERTRDRNRAWLDATNGMDAMFPLSDFEPVETTLGDLEDFMKQQLQINENYAATYDKRRAYLDDLESAVGGDLSATWEQAQTALAVFGDDA